MQDRAWVLLFRYRGSTSYRTQTNMSGCLWRPSSRRITLFIWVVKEEQDLFSWRLHDSGIRKCLSKSEVCTLVSCSGMINSSRCARHNACIHRHKNIGISLWSIVIYLLWFGFPLQILISLRAAVCLKYLRISWHLFSTIITCWVNRKK